VEKFRIVDLFAGIGGLRSGVIQSLQASGYIPEVVFTSEIKKHAISVLAMNHPGEQISGDITQVNEEDVPDHDILLAGFPCQAFSFAGTRKGFADTTKGTLFFDVARILKHKNPKYFILENVEGLLFHDPDPEKPSRGYGRTFNTILETLQSLDYNIDWALLSAEEFGVPQVRKRVFIVGAKDSSPNLSEALKTPSKPLSSILESGVTEPDAKVRNFSDLLTTRYSPDYLEGKGLRDKRGGVNNLHSWNFEYKGATTEAEKNLMEEFLIQTRRRKWAELKGKPKIECVPLTADDIKTFASQSSTQSLEEMLTNLSSSRYLIKEGDEYRIYSGRLSFPLAYIIDPSKYAHTIVATDADRIGVVDNGNIRRLTSTEIKRLFGFADDFHLPGKLSYKQVFDLFGNSVVIPVAKSVADCLISPKKP
jgi:DNA (cytosine-5)-methyltransferase 1